LELPSISSLRCEINGNGEGSEGELESENYFFDNQMSTLTEAILLDQLHSDHQTRYNIRTSYVEPLNNGTFVELKYQRQNFSNELRREVFDRLNGTSTFNDDLSNHYQRDYYFDRGAIAWHKNGEKSSLTVEGALQNSVLNGIIISENVVIKNSILRFLPRVSWRYELGTSNNIRFRYSTNVNEPSIVQLQPYPDVSDPINVYIGNPDLTPEYRARLNYMHYDQFSFRSLFAFLNFTYSKNKIANQSIIDDNFRQVTRPVNVDYDLNLSVNVNYSSPVSLLKSRVTIGTRASYQQSKVFLNSTENIRDRYIGNINAKIENRKKTTIDWEISGRWSYNITQYDMNPRCQKFFNKSTHADLTYNIKKSFSISTSMDINFYSEEQFGEAMTIPIWKASISKYILKDQKGEIKLSAFDILNQNIGISRVNGLNFVENSEITSLGRYLMFSFTYAIRATGSENKSGGRRMFMRG